MDTLIEYIGRCLPIALNIVVAFLLAPFINGIERKVRARLQNRVGPPVLQTWYDIFKLLRKESVTVSRAQQILIVLAFAQMLTSFVLIPIVCRTYPKTFGDLILLLYLITSSSVYLSLASATSGGVFGYIGTSREISLVMAYELLLSFMVATIGITTASFMLDKIYPFISIPPRISQLIVVALLLVLIYMESSRLPFELSEAEPEIAGGIITEFGGRALALALITCLLRRLALTAFFINMVVPRSIPYLSYLEKTLGIDLWFVLCVPLAIAIHIVMTMIEVYYGRYRMERALTWCKVLFVVAGLAFVLGLMGM